MPLNSKKFDLIFLFQTILMYTASTMAEVNVENDIVQRNGKTHLTVKNVKVNFEVGYFSYAQQAP